MLTYEEVWDGSDIAGWRFVEHRIGDTWRWGHWSEYVYQRLEDGKFFEFMVQVVSGDYGPNEGLWAWDDIVSDYYEVEPVTTISYRPVDPCP